MKLKILFAVVLALNTIGLSTAHADACAAGLMPAFTSAQATELCATFPISSVALATLRPGTDNAFDLGATSFSWRSLYLGTSRISLTSDILRVRQDAQRLFTWDASSDTAFTQKFGDAGVTAVQQLTISASTADADDDSTIIIAGGGAAGGTRGASITLPGEEVAGGSDITYDAGTGDTHIFSVAGVSTEVIGAGTHTITGTFTSSATSDLGWSVVAGANTACNTTCTSACVTGIDTLGTGGFLGCAVATADFCLCAGPS